MDKKSRQILKYMRSVNSARRADLLRRFGSAYEASIDFLLSEKYIARQTSRIRFVNRETGKHDPPVEVAFDNYHITGYGLGFLERYKSDIFLRWAPLVISTLSLVVSIFGSS